MIKMQLSSFTVKPEVAKAAQGFNTSLFLILGLLVRVLGNRRLMAGKGERQQLIVLEFLLCCQQRLQPDSGEKGLTPFPCPQDAFCLSTLSHVLWCLLTLCNKSLCQFLTTFSPNCFSDSQKHREILSTGPSLSSFFIFPWKLLSLQASLRTKEIVLSQLAGSMAMNSSEIMLPTQKLSMEKSSLVHFYTSSPEVTRLYRVASLLNAGHPRSVINVPQSPLRPATPQL